MTQYVKLFFFTYSFVAFSFRFAFFIYLVQYWWVSGENRRQLAAEAQIVLLIEIRQLWHRQAALSSLAIFTLFTSN